MKRQPKGKTKKREILFKKMFYVKKKFDSKDYNFVKC